MEKQSAVKKVAIWGIVLLSFLAVVWGLHDQENYTTLGKELVNTIRSEEVVEKVQLIDKENINDKEVQLESEENINPLMRSIWETGLKKRKTETFQPEYEFIIYTDADKQYNVKIGEKELLIQDKYYSIQNQDEFLETIKNQF